MKKAKFMAVLLVVALSVMLFPVPAHAEESIIDENTTSINVFNGTSTLTYDVILQDGEAYFPAEAYSEITKYTFNATENKYNFQLGEKRIFVDPKTGEIEIPVQHYTGNIGKVICKDGIDYLPASALLPWMNVACNINEGILEIIPDGISLWEIIYDLNYPEYMFNLYEEYGDSTSDIAGLSAMSIFDTIIHLRWDRLVPVDGTITGASKGGSLYDYRCYNAALTEIAQIDSFSYKNAESLLKNVIKVNNGLDTIEEVIGLDESKVQLDLDNYLRELGTDEETAILFYDLSEIWKNIREGIRDYEQVSKYLDVFSILKTWELATKTDGEYREYIHWLADQETGNTLFNRAICETERILDENTGVLYSTYVKYGQLLLSELSDTVVSAITNNTLDDTVINACNSYSDSVFGSLGQYMAVAQVAYGTIFPVASGYEGMAKAGILEKIQDYCWELALQLQADDLTEETIQHIRQSYITALKASRKNYEVQQDTMDVKILGLITVFDGEGLLDAQFDKIDEKILQLIASADATENDSISGKEEVQERLRGFFLDLESTHEQEQVPLFDETYWMWNLGPASGANFAVIFHNNGTFDCFHITDHQELTLNYQYENGILTVNGIEYSWVGTHFESIEGYFANGAAGDWICSFSPDSEQHYADILEEETEKKLERINKTPEILTTGYWYLYSPQSADCYEYEFSAESGIVTIRYREVMNGTGEFIFEPTVYQFAVNQDSNIVTIGENDVWTLDPETGRMWKEYYDGPADAMRTVYLEHYDERPDLETVIADGRAFLEYWRSQENG